VTFFSDERANELRDLFFESAQELLQALNEEGMELEKHPSDTEIIRTIRRTVHTLKGDSAACGLRELSELAHELEDVLTPEIAARKDCPAAQVVLSAADVFESMLAAYRSNVQPPSADALRVLIAQLRDNPQTNTVPAFAPQFAWSEYERLVIDQGRDGLALYNVAVQIDPACAMRSAAAQMVRNVLQESGKVLVIRPEDAAAQVDAVEAVLATERQADWIERKCRIPSITADVVVRGYDQPQSGTPEVDAVLELPPIETPEIVADGEAMSPPEGVLEVLEPVSVEQAGQPALSMSDQAVAPAERSAPSAAALDNILRVDAERIDTVLNLVGELIIGKSMLNQTVSEFAKRFPKDPLRVKFADMLAYQSQVLNELQRSVMKIRMVPVEQLFRRLPRIVRDLAKFEAKEVKLVVEGQDTDLDKSVLDALAEPMMHLVRNAVDHGIESPAERLAAGKPAEGTVRLNAYHQGNHVVIEVNDDGRGIDPQRVISKAIEKRVVSAAEASRMSDSDILDLIFAPGFSTAEAVTEVSGRGVGMDVVKTVLERLKGTVTVNSEPGVGTTFLLKVPLTLAIIRALLCRVADKLYAVPLNSVLEIARTTEGEIHRVDGREVIRLREYVLPLARLRRIASRNVEGAHSSRSFVVVIAVGDRKFGLVVDKLIGEEELVIKALDDHLVATDLVSGASILGDGTVVLILNVNAVVERLGRTRVNSSGTVESGTGLQELPSTAKPVGA